MAFYHIDKIFNITGNVKTQKIALKQASNNFTSPGNDVENIGGGKRFMVKESELYIRLERPHETRYLPRSEEHTSELHALMRIQYAVVRLTKKTNTAYITQLH